MATNNKQRQKKIEKKNKKRKLAKKTSTNTLNRVKKALHYAKYPIHECLVPRSLFEDGMGTVMFVRKTPFGELAVSSFLLDTFCKGVKDAYFKMTDEYEYETQMKPQMEAVGCKSGFVSVSGAYARKLVEQMVDYAKALDIKPHKDYFNAKDIFADIDVGECDETFEFGYGGKPFYQPGPHESVVDIQQTIAKLITHCGEGNFHLFAPLDQMEEMDYPEFDEDEQLYWEDDEAMEGQVIEGEVISTKTLN